MLDYLISTDRSLFLFINHLPHSPFLNNFFGILSGVGYAGIIWMCIGLALFAWEEMKERRSLMAQLIALTGSFLLVDIAMKNLFQRLRPQFRLPTTVVVLDPSSSFSFPSGHATTAFAMAYVLSRYHPKWKAYYYILALLIAFSRIYLGKHYPSDIIVGMMVGTAIGICADRVTIFLISKFKK